MKSFSKTILLIIIGIFISIHINAQSKIDSLKNILNFEIADTSKINILNQLASEYSSKSLETSNKYLQEALILSKNTSDKKYIIKVYLNASRICRIGGDYKNALSYDIKALNLSEKLNSKINISKALNNIGINHYRLNNFDKALEYQNKALKEYTVLNNFSGIADCYNNIAMVHDENKRYDEAVSYYNKAFLIYEKENMLIGMANVYNNIAGIHYSLRENDKVIEYAFKAMGIFKQMDNQQMVSALSINIGVFYNQIGEYKKAIEITKDGIDIAFKVNLLSQKRQGYKSLSEIYSGIKNYKNAFEYQQLYIQVKDSIFNIDKTKSIQEIQTKYETEKKEQKIKNLKNEAIIKDVKLNKSRILWISLLVILILLIIIGFSLIKQNKLKAERNKILLEKNKQLKILNATKTKFFAIISHDLLNPVSAFHTLTKAIETSFNDIEKDQLYDFIKELNKSSEKTYLLLQNLLAWASVNNGRMKYIPKNINLHNLTQEVISVLQINADEKQININSNIKEDVISYTDKLMISTVLRNLISNAIKFSSKKSSINIFSEEENGIIKITVKDTGKGLSEEDIDKLFKIEVDINKIGDNEEKGTGLGLILCKELTEKCGGKIWTKSELNEGSEFTFTVPRKKM